MIGGYKMVSGTKKLFIAILSVLFMFSLVFCVGSVPVKAETDYSSFEVIGAGIRVDDSKTIRFVTRIEKDVLDKIEGKVEVVTMITPERYLEREKINNADGFKADANVQMNKVVFSEAKGNLKKVVEKVDETNDGIDNPIEYYHFNGCIYDVQEHNMSYPFAARSYITVDGGDPVAYTPYDVSGEDPVVTASLFEVAEKAIASGEYTEDTDIKWLEDYTKSYDVHFVSTDYADVTATVKHGYNLKDVAEIQHPCATITGFSGYDGEFITSQPAGDVTVNYSIEHNFADGACKDCGLTTPEDFSFENSLSKDWAKVWVGECNLKDVTVDGKEMQKFSVSSKKTGDKTTLKLTLTESGYDYLYARFYVDSAINPETTWKRLRLTIFGETTATNNTIKTLWFDSNGNNITPASASESNPIVVPNAWYTVVVDISALDPSSESPLNIMWRPDNGAKIGCSVYIADTILVKDDSPLPVGATEKTWAKEWGSNAYGIMTHRLFEDKIVNDFTANETGDHTKLKMTGVPSTAEYLVCNFYVDSFTGGAGTGTSTARFRVTCDNMLNSASGYLESVTTIYYDDNGTQKTTAWNNLDLDKWYCAVVDLTNVAKGDSIILRLWVNGMGAVNGTVLFGDTYIMGEKPDGAKAITWSGNSGPGGSSTVTTKVVDGVVVQDYKTVENTSSYYARLKTSIPYTYNTVKLDVYIYDSQSTNGINDENYVEGYSCLRLGFGKHDGSSLHTATQYVEKSTGEIVSEGHGYSKLKLNTWYTLTIDISSVVPASGNLDLTSYPNIGAGFVSFGMYIANTYFYNA